MNYVYFNRIVLQYVATLIIPEVELYICLVLINMMLRHSDVNVSSSSAPINYTDIVESINKFVNHARLGIAIIILDSTFRVAISFILC